MGGYDADNFPDTYTNTLSSIFLFLIVIVMLNVLIAIVGDSYGSAMAKSTQLFWSARMELVAEVSTTFSWIMRSRAIAAIGKVVSDFGDENKTVMEESWGMKLFNKLLIIDDSSCISSCWTVLMIFPVTIPLLCLAFVTYSFFFKLLQSLARQASPSAEIDLGDLSGTASGGDAWSGRVLDIVSQVNEHSTESASTMEQRILAKVEEQLAATRGELTEMRGELAALAEIKEMLSVIDSRRYNADH